MLQVGDIAPTLPNHPYTKWTLVYFYPKDFTPGCTTQACSLRDNFSQLSQKATIIGISADSEESHVKFKSAYQLPFDLIADPDKTLIQAFGADGLIFPKRVSFVISPKGEIVKIYPKVDVKSHAEDILQDLLTFG